MSWVLAILTGWALSRLLAWLYRKLRGSAADRIHYRLEPEENWVLALAHPMACDQIEGGFADSRLPTVSLDLAQLLRPQLLHLFGLPTNLADERIRESLPARLDRHWFRIDLDALRPDDDPRDAMAFACARVTFAVRAAAMMGWISVDHQWQVLHQNGERAGQCFTSWLDYGTAWARGRRQWVARARADGLGAPFSEDDVRNWMNDSRHPWRRGLWPKPVKATA